MEAGRNSGASGQNRRPSQNQGFFSYTREVAIERLIGAVGLPCRARWCGSRNGGMTTTFLMEKPVNLTDPHT
jgi:hypothetical protein